MARALETRPGVLTLNFLRRMMEWLMGKSSKVSLSTLIKLVCFVCLLTGALASEVTVKTFVYKKAGDLEIKLDLHRLNDEAIRPLAVWIHGGALIMGGREAINRRVKAGLLDAGYALVSLDYRLAPETKLPAIIEDLEDAFTWLRANGREKLKVDSSKIAVVGDSAGGYMTLAAGFRVKPAPTVLAAFWGYGDLVGDWYGRPSDHYKSLPNQLAPAEARRLVNGPPVANGLDREGDRSLFDAGPFYHMCRRLGSWPEEVAGWHPRREEEKFIPYMPVRNVTPDYPPTMLIHGSKDADVPVQQSLMMADQFAEKGVTHKLIVIGGGRHGLGGGDERLIEEAYRDTLDFINLHMGNH
jgi:acetyl esterase/lipase